MPLCSRDKLFRELWRESKFNVHTWVARLLSSVQSDPADKFARKDLLELSHSLLKHHSMTSQERKKAYRGKALFPAFTPHHQIVVSLALEDRSTFEEALQKADTHLLTFQAIGNAMCIFNIGTGHST